MCRCWRQGSRCAAMIPGRKYVAGRPRIWRQKGKPYDKDAQWASEGKVLLPLLQDMLSDPWFALPAPKSTGREYFNYGWLEQHMARYPGLRGEDVQATLAELTAVTISEQVLLSGGCERLLVCGGGARNPC